MAALLADGKLFDHAVFVDDVDVLRWNFAELQHLSVGAAQVREAVGIRVVECRNEEVTRQSGKSEHGGYDPMHHLGHDMPEVMVFRPEINPGATQARVEFSRFREAVA